MGKKPAYSVVIALSVISTLVVTLFLGGIATTLAQNDGLALYVSSTSALANQRISLSGTGFTADAEIGEVAEGETQVSGITLEGKDIPWDRINGGNTVSIDSDGAWSATVDLPVNAVTTAEGYKTIKATDSTGVSDTREIRIKQRAMFIDPDSERVGTIALVVGGGFPARNDNVPSFPVTITYDTGSGTGTTQSVVPHANGEIRANIRIPTTASIPSSNTVKVSFQDDDGVIVEETAAHEVLPSLIDFYPTTGIPGNTFYVTVAGYKPYVPVQSVTLNGRDMSQGRQLATNVDGNLEFGFHIPPMDPATYPVEFVLGGVTFSSSFTLRAGPTPIPAPTATPAPSPTPTVTPTPTPAPDEPPEKIRLSRSSGPPGAVVTVYGEGFHPFLPMRRVDVGDVKASPDPRPSTDKDGRITFDVIIPSLEPGTYHFDVRMGTSVSGNFAWASVDFTVTALPTPTPTPAPTATPAPTLAPQLPGAKEPPHVFMGTARLDGLPVAEGTPISAYDGTRLVGATESGPNGKFSIHTHRVSNLISFAVDNIPASEVWSQWESGRVTRGFHLTAGSFSHTEDLPETLFRDNPSLEAVFFYDNARKVWEFYDPLIGSFNTLEKFVSGQPYLFLVKRNAWVVMNGTERYFSCVDDNCWNQVLW